MGEVVKKDSFESVVIANKLKEAGSKIPTKEGTEK